MHPRILVLFIFLMVSMVSCKSLHRKRRDGSSPLSEVVKMAAENKQVGGAGLFSFGTLVSPLLFMMGMGSFMSMLPQMFQRVMQGVGPNLFQLFRPNLAAISGGSSSRLKRSADFQSSINEDILNEIERRLNLALMNNEKLY